MKNYDFDAIEKKWQKRWEEAGTYNVTEEKKKNKYYCLEMLPYASGRLHMGHTRNYSIGDAISRFKRMCGFNVLHPIGFDSFGLPAENAALENKTDPKKWTLSNIEAMRKQFKRLGISYDWEREVITCLPEYYRWNQWFFLKMYDRGLAYRKRGVLNWCDKCRTVLANEQVQNGFCWRHSNTPVKQKEMEQWYFRYSDFAEELLEGLDDLKDWSERVVVMQRNWIGKSEGSRIDFPVKGKSKSITVFTTRIDTIYGATFMVMAPNHPLIDELIEDKSKLKEIKKFAEKVRIEAAKRSYDEEPEKEGIDTGLVAINPFTKKRIPVWISNFVLMDYGTGAVMSVPAHDQRDYEFAEKYGLKIKPVILPINNGEKPEQGRAYEEKGVLTDSNEFTGLTSDKAIDAMNKYAEDHGFGSAAVDYKLKDWCLSRQRFWGTPIPIIYCDSCGIVPVPEKDLPVRLPEVDTISDEGIPLASIDEFINVECPGCGKPAKRETDTMDTFVDSAWYQLRYCSPNEDKAMINSDAVNYWCPVDIYIGGIEHAVGHLMYFRYFYQRLRDFGLIDTSDEPARRVFVQGMVVKDGAKMSKSKGNVVDPNDMIDKYGADTTRMFSLFAAPPEKDLEWNEAGVEGIFRFLNRVWNAVQTHLELIKDADFPAKSGDYSQDEIALRRKTHQTIKKVTLEVGERLHFNTAIAAIMELLNEINSFDKNKNKNAPPVLKEAIYNMIVLLTAFAPHIAEELYEQIGGEGLVVDHQWPEHDEKIAAEEMVTVVIQVNGKLRDSMDMPVDSKKEEVISMAKDEPKIKKYLEGTKIVKEVYVPNRLVNFVVNKK